MSYLVGFFAARKQKGRCTISQKKNERTERTYLRVSPQEKKKIDDLAKSCGLSTAEYLRRRALGFTPPPAIPDAFFIFNEKLCELLNRELSPETEATALQIFDEMHTLLSGGGKQTKKEVVKEVNEWQLPDSGP